MAETKGISIANASARFFIQSACPKASSL